LSDGFGGIRAALGAKQLSVHNQRSPLSVPSIWWFL
jgi:hypothetical protein